jgi:hypothetical protein
VLTQDDLERERYEARIKLQRDASSRILAARLDGLEQGELIGRIQTWQRFLKYSVTPREELLTMPLEQLQHLADQLEKDFKG